MSNVNIDALKIADNLKWDFQIAYQRALQCFNYSGEVTEEYKTAVTELRERLKLVQSHAETLIKEAEKIAI